MTLEGPYQPSFESAWGNVLAELEGGASGDGNAELDRFASLDLVSNLLSSEGFEAFSTPGDDEQKLTRYASLELLSELFGVEGEGQSTLLEEGSGVSNGSSKEALLAETAQVQKAESNGWQMDLNWTSAESGLACEGAVVSVAHSKMEMPNQGLLQQAVPHRASKVPQPRPGSVPARASKSLSQNSPFPKVLPAIPPFRGTGHAPSQTTAPTPCLVNSDPLSDPLANPRTRFTPKQQRALYDFGVSINWVIPGLEAEPRAHKLCTKLGIGFRQLKKWVSNHRPREHKSPVSNPPWILPAGVVTRGGPHPQLSQAALASLAAAEAAVMGQPFPSPFDATHPVQGPYPPLHNAWPHPHAPGGPFLGELPPPFQAPFASEGVDAPQFVPGGLHSYRWGSGGSGESNGSQSEGRAEPGENKGVASEDVKIVLTRKLKDFEPEKVRKLFDLCVEYRQKRSSLKMEANSMGHSEPPSKRQRMAVSDPPLQTGPIVPPLTPPNLPIQTGLTFSSESGEISEVTQCEEPRACLPKAEPVSSGGWQIPVEKSPLESGGSFPCAWNGGSLEGQPLSTLPSFPSIDLTEWGTEGLLGANPEAPAPVTPQLVPETSGFGYVVTNPDFECPVDGIPVQPLGAPMSSGPGEFWSGVENRRSGSRAERNPPRLTQRKSSGLTRRVSTGLTARGSTGLAGQCSTGLTGRCSPGLTGRVSIGLTGRGSTSLTGRVSTGLIGRPPTGLTKRPSTGLTQRTSAGSKKQKAPVQLPGCKFLFEKTLTMSDTTPLGRIIVPKVHAEAHLPRVAGRDCAPLPVTDADGRIWELRYSAWLNNKSRMYVLEHVGDLLQARRLAPGDSIAFYRANDGRLIMMDQKLSKPSSFSSSAGECTAAGGFGIEGAF